MTASYWGLVKKCFKEKSIFVFLMLLSVTIVGIIEGFLMADVIQRITQAILDKSGSGIKEALFFLGGVILLNLLCVLCYRFINFYLTREITISCEDKLYQKYRHQTYWTNAEEVLGQIRKNVPETVKSMMEQIYTTYRYGIALVSGCIYAISLNWVVLLVCVSITGVMLLFSQRALSKLAPLYKDFAKQQSGLYNRLWEQVNNREMARFMLADRAAEPYQRESDRFIHNLLRIKKAANGAQLFATFGSVVMIIIVSLLGGTLVVQGALRVAELLALVIVIPTVSTNIFNLPQCIANWKQVIGRSHSITELLSKKESIQDGTKKITAISRISVNKLTFGYSDEPILDNLDVQLTPGFYAIAGASGCGKSTFLHLMAKLLPCQQGEISMDAIPLSDLKKESYWKQVGLGTQNPVVLRDTLRYNIAMTEENWDEARLWQAIHDAQLEEVIDKLEKGLDTVVSANSLSKGEGQRVSAARLFYRSSRLVLLDEITSALDPKSERHILQAFQRRCKESGQIVLCVSHRKAALELSDEVLFFDDGKIRSRGSHAELLQSCSSYQELLREVTP